MARPHAATSLRVVVEDSTIRTVVLLLAHSTQTPTRSPLRFRYRRSMLLCPPVTRLLGQGLSSLDCEVVHSLPFRGTAPEATILVGEPCLLSTRRLSRH